MNKTIKTQGKAAMALAKIKSGWGKYGIDELDIRSEGAVIPKSILEKIQAEWDEALAPYTEKTIKMAIANYALFHFHKEQPPSLEDMQVQLAKFHDRDEVLGEMDADQLLRQHDFAEQQKKLLTTLRRWGIAMWRHEALREFYHNGAMFRPAWSNFLSSIAKIDEWVIASMCKQIDVWNNGTPEGQRLVDMNRRDLAIMYEILQSEIVR